DRRLREQTEILSNSHEGVMIVDLDDRISFWNRGAEAIFGWTAMEALGQPPDRILGVTDREQVRALRRAVEQAGHWSGELKAQRRDQRSIIVESRVTLVR